MILRRPVGSLVWMAALLALVGVAVLAHSDGSERTSGTLAIAPPFRLAGEAILVASAILFTGHILAVDRYAGRADPTRLSLVMFATTAVASAGFALVLGGPLVPTADIALALTSDLRWMSAMGIIVVVCSLLAYHGMNAWQPAIPPAVATVIYCLEPVFATACSLALGQERLTTWTVIGGGLVVVATLLLMRRQAPSSGV